MSLANVDRLERVERDAVRPVEQRRIALRGERGARDRLVGVPDELHGLAGDLKPFADLADTGVLLWTC